ncbi:MAG: hypothetical protein JSR73_04160 [Proteobacteria bacterium]|nr:hypothetical protein [Pseudomonadota bacterium]
MPANESSIAVATFVVDALTRKLGRRPVTDLNPSESALLTVARFWIAAHERDLARLLQPEPLLILIVARQSFAEIGAVHCAQILQSGISRCSSPAGDADAAAGIAAWLEATLPQTPDRIDRLLERFLLQGVPPVRDG